MKTDFISIINHSKSIFIGCDECGYGSLAGPLVVCAVRAPKEWLLPGLNDSKKLSEKRRYVMRDKLNKLAEEKIIKYHIAERSNEIIDKDGVASALKSAYIECMIKLDDNKDCLIITDGILKFDNLGVDDYDIVSLIKADEQVPCVMAASIIGKTYRDDKMRELHKSYPEYEWNSNVGYGSADHMEAMRKHGLSPLHRRTFKVKSLIDLYE